MAYGMSFPDSVSAGGFFVPGTSVTAGVPIHLPASRVDADGPTGRPGTRDPALRNLYLERALAAMPRLLGAIDRNPFRPTYGCFDRQYWHYRTSSFPSEMYQEGVLPLALVCATSPAGQPLARRPPGARTGRRRHPLRRPKLPRRRLLRRLLSLRAGTRRGRLLAASRRPGVPVARRWTSRPWSIGFAGAGVG